ncbi:J domain-containing protein [uncultured Methylobacterium sp.]|uniref:J domain-containing protein n=1 Tax=uncultured Methylobacterium sp. TaxID=157278 RepID=UPI0035CACD2B
MTSAYPLSWPNHIPRSRTRETGSFRTSLPAALDNVETSLKLFGRDSRKPVSGIVLSSNVTLGTAVPADPGVAAWFSWDGIQVCIPVDRYTKPAANLQAIHHVLEARRTELRHGTLALVRATLQGLIALPEPAKVAWWEVLQIERTASPERIDTAFKRLARERHPDRLGGSTDAMAELNRARDEAMKDKGND